jgi:hypothetical protein
MPGQSYNYQLFQYIIDIHSIALAYNAGGGYSVPGIEVLTGQSKMNIGNLLKSLPATRMTAIERYLDSGLIRPARSRRCRRHFRPVFWFIRLERAF